MSLFDYLFKQYPECKFTLSGNDPASLVWDDENPMEKPTIEELESNTNYVKPPLTDEEIAAQEAAVKAIQYRNLRANEYPSIVDQLDTLYHGGYDVWKEQIKAVKDKYPKGAK